MDTLKALSILGLGPRATKDEVRNAYLAMSRGWHPDTSQGSNREAMEEGMKRLNSAYRALRDYAPSADPASSAYRRGEHETPHREAGTCREHAGTTHRSHDAPPAVIEDGPGGPAIMHHRTDGLSPSTTLRSAFRLAFVMLAAGTLFWGVYAAVAIIGGFLGGPGKAAMVAGASSRPAENAPGYGPAYTPSLPPAPPVWMSSSVATTTYRNGDPITHARTTKQWKAANRMRTGAWCRYGNDPAKGVLYNRHALNDPRGLAPEGWHIPDEREWAVLAGQGDLSIFAGEHGGFRKSNGKFSHYGKRACFWIAGSRADNNNMALELNDFDFTREGDIIDNDGEGYSVRCIKN